ncbi:MAG TPA: radical SAM protein [Anaerolineaceae bacterium]|nr:radical SAM protein [Anaerolineaceae bacterium]
MEAFEKLALLGEYMNLEPAGEPHPAPQQLAPDSPPSCFVPGKPDAASRPFRPVRSPDDLPVTMVALPNGQRMPILKTLLTSACEKNCNYCAFRAGRNFRRATFSPDELGQTFMRLADSGKVRGLFLSSGVAGGGMKTQDRLIAAAEILRYKLGYKGYIHLKIMPGSEFAQVERAMQLANRVSVNLESPTTERLARLAPQKVFLEELVQPLRWVDKIRRTESASAAWNGRWPSSTTQFVAGGAGESDLELLRTSEYLHRKLGLARVYFSGFSPVADTPLENQAPIDPWREHRLYQADFLLRDYGFSVEDMPFMKNGDLPLDNDPKLAWAKAYLAAAPVEVNRADLHELLRVPGIGPRGARAILSNRRKSPVKSLDDLKAWGVVTTRAAPFITFSGKQAAYQIELW